MSETAGSTPRKNVLSRAERMFPSFADMLRKAKEEHAQKTLERAARSEQQVRDDISGYVRTMVDACMDEGGTEYEKKASSLGLRYTWIGDMELVGVSIDGSGESDSIYYLNDAENKIYRTDENTGEFVEVNDTFIHESATKLLSQHNGFLRKRAENRKKTAEELSGGNELLRMVMEAHLAYTNGHPSTPNTVDGIDFYAVGRNASHDFSLGVKDGKMYKKAFGESGRRVYDPADPLYRTMEELIEAGLISDEQLSNPDTVAFLMEEYNSETLYETSVYEITPDNIGYVGHY